MAVPRLDVASNSPNGEIGCSTWANRADEQHCYPLECGLNDSEVGEKLGISAAQVPALR
jgi:hypothetical protein